MQMEETHQRALKVNYRWHNKKSRPHKCFISYRSSLVYSEAISVSSPTHSTTHHFYLIGGTTMDVHFLNRVLHRTDLA